MITYSKVTEAPDTEPVSLAEARNWLKIDDDYTGDDVLIESLIKVARRYSESYTGRSFFTQVRKMKLDQFPCWSSRPLGWTSWANWRRHDGIIVPYGPIQSIDSIKYLAPDGNEQTLDPSEYTEDLDSDLARLFPVDSWPSTSITPNGIVIEYTAGYDSVSGVFFPEEAKIGMLLKISSLYEKREDVAASLRMESDKYLDVIKVYWNANTD